MESLFITLERIKAGDEVQNWTMIEFYWLTIVDFAGEHKERFRFLDEDHGVRKLMEKVLKEYEVVETIVKFIDVEELRGKYAITEAKGRKEKMGNDQVFVGLKKKES